MTQLFLTKEQLTELTGYKFHSKQALWLAENGYSFDIRSDGRPNVLHQQVIERQCRVEPKRRRSEPNLAALD